MNFERWRVSGRFGGLLTRCMLVLLVVAFTIYPVISHASDTDSVLGPVVNAGMRVKVNGDGVSAPGYRFHNDLKNTAPLTAQWIALDDRAHATDSRSRPFATLFRKAFTLVEAPKRAVAWVSSTGRYRLWVNGVPASRGPADYGRDYSGMTSHRWFYDCRDITHLLHKGQNVFAVEVTDGNARLMLESEILGATGTKTHLATDPSWHALAAPHLSHRSWNPPADAPGRGSNCLHWDNRKEPTGWQRVEFADTAWSPCQTATGPDETLVASEIPGCMEGVVVGTEVVRPSNGVNVPANSLRSGSPITLKSDGSFAVHFPRVMAAYYGIRVKGSAGTQIALQANEANQPGFNRMGVVILRDGEQSFETPEMASVGTLNLVVSNVTGPLEIESVYAITSSQPADYRGEFQCSDEALNRIWRTCRWAVEINLQTHHLDSPHHQEPICDYGDYLIEDLCAYYAFGENWLARQDLRKFAWVMENSHYQTFHTSYQLLWLQTLLAYYDYTGDTTLVKELAPHVHAVLDRFTTYIGKNGILSEAPNYMFMDWVEIEGFPGHHPPAVIGQNYLTAFYYRALADARRVAQLTHDTTRAQWYEELRKQIAPAYEKELWNPGKGLYRDGKPFQTSVKPGQWLPADRDIETFTAQANTLAVLYDLAPASRQPDIIDRILNQKPWNVRPYYLHFVLDAVAHAGAFDKYGTQWMRDKWKIVPDTQSFYEMGDTGDLSHAWIATPLYQMSSRILGVTPATPGFKSIAIRPTVCDLKWAKGRVPTPYGDTVVDWKREGGNLKVQIVIPKGATGEIYLPQADPHVHAFTINGYRNGSTKAGPPNEITAPTSQGTTLCLKMKAGRYDIVVPYPK